MTTTCLRVDPELLLAARRELLRHATALSVEEVAPPATGATSELTVEALARVGTVVGALVDDLVGLARALERFVDDLADQDGRVTAQLDRLRRGTRA